LTLSDSLPKLDATFTSTVSKLLDTLRTLVEDGKLSQHARVNDRDADAYLMGTAGGGWKWDKGRWGEGGKVGEVVDALTKVCGAFFDS
jgi:V-type H+-transporting ATPase subunit C